MISCRPWSSRIHPYPLLARKMKTYLELKDKLVVPPCSNPMYTDRPNSPSPQRSQAPRVMPTKEPKKRSRNHQKGRRQYKVRLIEKPLLLYSMATPQYQRLWSTTVTATPPTMANLRNSSTACPTATPTTVPASVFKFPSTRSQENPNPLLHTPWQRPH